MNFINSVFSHDQDSESDSESDNAHQSEPSGDSSPAEHQSDSSGAGGAWDFGGLLKTLSAKSESIMEIYRRDLQEFGTGLKKEIEVAQESLESVGHAIDHFGSTVVNGTAQIMSQLDSDSDSLKKRREMGSGGPKRYSRFDSLVRAIQGDVSTYSEVAEEDLDDYNRWKSEFSLEGKSEEMEGLFGKNEAMESVYERVVPNTVDRETFWLRYYYKVYKLKKAEEVRARLVRSMSRDEEELSWDVDDDDDDDGDGDGDGDGDDDDDDDDDEDEDKHVEHGKPELVMKREDADVNQREEGDSELKGGGFDANSVKGTKEMNVDKVEKRDELLQMQSEGLGNKMDDSVEESKGGKNSGVVQEMMGDGSKKIGNEGDDSGKRNDSAAADSDKKVIVQTKDEDGKSALVASQHSARGEEDLEWDEIEDLSSIDGKKKTTSPSKVDLRKRLNAAEEEEDLSWDIEDDEPAKA